MKKNIKVFETDNYVKIHNVCQDALKKYRMHTVIGYPGAGKSVALTAFARANERVYYMWVKKSMKTKEFYLGLLKSLGVVNQDPTVSPNIIMDKIAWMLNDSGPGNLLIIDEAGKFKPGQLEYIHQLRDETDTTTGIVLSGPEYFFDNLKSWEKGNVIGIPELIRRIHAFVWLDRPKRHEIKSICNHWGITDQEALKKFYLCNDFDRLAKEIEDFLEKNRTIKWSFN